MAKASAPQEEKIYPDLPEIPENVDNYRYSKILILQKEIKEEILKYTHLSKKYGKARKIFNGFNHFTNGLSFAAGSTAVATFAAGVTIFASIPLAAISGLSSLIGSGFTFLGSKMAIKQIKHRETLETAKNTLLNLKRLVAKLVTDGKVTQEEFEAVLELEKNYNELKMDIRKSTPNQRLKQAFKNGQKSMRKLMNGNETYNMK